MHPLLGFLLLGFASYALGNFWVFEGDTNTGEEIYPGYRFFNCDEVGKSTFWAIQSDVSGNKQGVRVEGASVLSPDVFEANVGQVHFTIYRNRGNGVFDVAGNQHGSCRVLNGVDYTCTVQGDSVHDRSVYHCNSDYVATEMN